MNKESVREHVIYQDDAIELSLLEQTVVATVDAGSGRYCCVQMSPIALLVSCAGGCYTLDMQGQRHVPDQTVLDN